MRTSTAPTTLAVIGLLSGAFLAAACGSDSDTGATSDTGTPQDSAPATLETAVDTAAAGFPLEIENCGRTLTFEAPPERVVTGYHPSFELMAELGLGDRLIGRTPYDEEGPDGAGVLPEHKDLYDSVPQISDSISFPAAEEMLALGADFVLSEGYYNFDAADGAATIDELEASGANGHRPQRRLLPPTRPRHRHPAQHQSRTRIPRLNPLTLQPPNLLSFRAPPTAE